MHSPRNTWTISKQRKLIDSIALKIGVKRPSDWSKVTNEQVNNSKKIVNNKVKYHGGGYVLNHYHKGSIPLMLQKLYPEVSWQVQFRNYRFWNKKENQREFFLQFAKKHGIVDSKEWGNISQIQILESGGGSILNLYSGSTFKTLSSVFPEIEWKEEWFAILPRGYWSKKENQRKYLEEVSRKLNIREWKDWGKFKKVELEKKYAIGRFVNRHYHGSFQKALFSIFPGEKLKFIYSLEVPWERKWFQTISKHIWENSSIQRRFLDDLIETYHLKTATDWKRVSVSLLKKKGGQTLFQKYGCSIANVLQEVYPNSDWSALSNYSPITYSRAHKTLSNSVSSFLK